MEMRSILVVLFLAVLADARQYVCPKVNNYLSRDQCKGVRDMCGSHRDCASRDHLCCPTEGECYLSCQIAVPQSTEVCHHHIDLALVLDTSRYAGRKNWEMIKVLAKDMVDAFDVRQNKTHISIMTMGTHGKIEIKFNKYTGVHLNAVNIKRDIDGLKWENGSLDSRELKMIEDEIFTTEAGMRSNVPRECVIMSPFYGFNSGYEVFGNNKGVTRYSAVVSTKPLLPPYIITPFYVASDISLLFGFQKGLNRQSLKRAIKTFCQRTCQTPMDLGLVLSSSTSVDRKFWENMKLFAKTLVDSFNISESETHFSLMTFTNRSHIDIKFNKYQGPQLTAVNIKQDIDGLQWQKGDFLMSDKGRMKKISEMFTDEAGMRQNVPKACVIVTDNHENTPSDDDEDDDDNAKNGTNTLSLEEKGVQDFVVTVGKRVSREFYYSARTFWAKNPNNDLYLQFDDNMAWKTKVKNIIEKHCRNEDSSADV